MAVKPKTKPSPNALPPPRKPTPGELKRVEREAKEWGSAFREHLAKLEVLSPEDLRARAC